MKVQKLVEVSTSRIYQRLTDESNCAIVSPYRGENSKKENEQLMVKLKADVRDMGLGFSQFISRWVEDGEAFDESSLLIPNISLEDAIALGKKYHQSSIIYKDKDSCKEICTTPFETYTDGDTVRVFNTNGKSVLNIEDAKAIFSRRVGGPVSKPVKGGNTRPFTLKTVDEVYEVEQPKASVFSTEYRYNRIL